MQNIIFAWRQDSRLSRFRSRHRCYSNQMWKLSSTNLVSFMRTFLLFDESLCQRRIFFSSSHDSLASISHLLLEQFIDFYHDQFAQIRCLSIFTLATRHVTSTSHSTSLATFVHHRSSSLETFAHDHSSFLEIFTHDRSSSLDAFVTITHQSSKHSSRSFIVARRTRHDRSSSLDVFVTIVHCRSTHSSRSFIIARRTRHDCSRSLESFTHDRSTLSTIAQHQLKLWRINSSKLAKILKKKYCHDFKLEICSWDLSRFDTSLDTRVYFDFVVVIILFSMYLVHNITNILVYFTHTSICFLFMLMSWQQKNNESWVRTT